MRDTETFYIVDKCSALRGKVLRINLHIKQNTLKLTKPNDPKLDD